jgi:hypothetical protein
MRKIEFTQTDTSTWAASSAGIATDIERLGVITRIVCSMELTPSATFDGANQPDGLFRPVQNMRLEGGGFTYFTLPGDAGGLGGTLWHYYNRENMGVMGHASGDVTAPHRSFVPVSFWWHPGSRPVTMGRKQNPFDMTALVPALHDASLRAIWTTGPNSVMDDTITLASAVMRYTLYYIVGTNSEMQAEMRRQRVNLPVFDRGVPTAMVPNWHTITHAATATFTDYQQEHNIPTGGYLRQLWILSQDDTATRPLRAADEITDVKIMLPGQEVPIQVHAEHLTNQQMAGSGLIADDGDIDFGNRAPEGIIPIDFRPFGHDDYGLNLEHVSSGSAKVGTTVTAYASGDDHLMLFDKLHPYFGQLGFPG